MQLLFFYQKIILMEEDLAFQRPQCIKKDLNKIVPINILDRRSQVLEILDNHISLSELISSKSIIILPYQVSNLPLIEIISDETEINVAPRQYVVSKFNDEIRGRMIWTYCAGPCHILIIYDRKNQTWCIAHIDHLVINFDQSFNEMLSKFTNIKDLHINLYWGNNLPDSVRVRNEIMAKFKKDNIEYWHETNNSKVRSMAIDLKTGLKYELVASHIDRQVVNESFEKWKRWLLQEK